MNDPLFVLAVLSLNVVLSEWLARKTFCRHFGTALLVILITAVVANLGIIPSASNATGLYDVIFSYVAPIAIFFLLLEVNLKDLRKAGIPMLSMFLVGSAATVLGVLAGIWAVDGKQTIGPLYHAIAGMFTGTYTGGSINFNAVALYYDVVKEGNLYAGSVVVDNIITTLWMIATIGLPKLLFRFFPRNHLNSMSVAPATVADEVAEDSETIHPLHLGILIGLGALTLWLSNLLSVSLADRGIEVPSILILTTIALVLAQVPAVRFMNGRRVLGLYSVYIFLAVIGAFCEITAIGRIGALGLALLGFASVLCLVHGIVTFGLGALFKQDWNLIAIASQANIGGSTSALALSRSLGRGDLFLPAILVGSLGNGIGTYLGFWVAGMLGG